MFPPLSVSRAAYVDTSISVLSLPSFEDKGTIRMPSLARALLPLPGLFLTVRETQNPGREPSAVHCLTVQRVPWIAVLISVAVLISWRIRPLCSAAGGRRGGFEGLEVAGRGGAAAAASTTIAPAARTRRPATTHGAGGALAAVRSLLVTA